MTLYEISVKKKVDTELVEKFPQDAMTVLGRAIHQLASQSLSVGYLEFL